MKTLLFFLLIFALGCTKPDCNSIFITVNDTEVDYDIGVRYNGGECGSAQWSDYEFHDLENATYTVYIMHRSPRVMIDKKVITFERKECETQFIEFNL
jgi:hypothetical protein